MRGRFSPTNPLAPRTVPISVPLAAGVLSLATCLIVGCAAFGAMGEPCSEVSLGSIVAECRLRVERECPRDADIESCPAVRECDAMVDEWEACK